MSSGNFYDKVYKVEYRKPVGDPEVLRDGLSKIILDDKWRVLDFRLNVCGQGIPLRKCHHHAHEYGYFPYETAEAIRWRFLASLGFDRMFVETRLAIYDYKEAYQADRIGASEAFSIPGRPDEAIMSVEKDK